MNISDFVKGQIYNRNDLISAFKGSFMRGMNKCKRTNTLVLISKHTSNRLYGDKLFENNQIIYTGEGQRGDQSYTGANKDLLESEITGLTVYLFVVFKRQEYTFYGQVHLNGNPYFENELDADGNDRKVIRFPLVLHGDFVRLSQSELSDIRVGGVIPERKTLQVVGAAIVDGEGKVLCAQRGYGQLKGKWEFPGGKLEKGENDREALQREIKEELDIDVEVDDFIDENFYQYENFDIYLRVYKCKYLNGRINDTEHQSLKWIDGRELDTLDWAAADKPIVETYMDSLPRIINGSVSYRYLEAEPVKRSDRELLRAVQDYERSQRTRQQAGQLAEEAVINYERDKLYNLGRPDLADKVQQVSKTSSDFGYDILSYDISNNSVTEIHIEVKSAKHINGYIEFFISENELNKFKTDNNYRVYCLIKVGRNYKLHVVDRDDFFKTNYLSPMTYRVRIRVAE